MHDADPTDTSSRVSSGRSVPPWFDVDLAPVPRTSWRLVGLVLALLVAFTGVVNLWLFRNETVRTAVFRPLLAATGGLVTPTLLVNLGGFAVIVGGVLFRGAGLSPAAVGLTRRAIGRGVAVTVLVWVAIQVVGAAARWWSTGAVAVAEGWTTGGAGPLVGAFLAQALGNALLEEVVYRGFLLSQVFLLLDRRIAGGRSRLAVALLGSQAAFTLLHVPNRLFQGVALGAIPGNLSFVFLSGLLYALVYYRTGNLFVAVGIHALGNAPLAVLASPALASALTNPAMVVVVLAWRPLDRWLSAVERALGGDPTT